MVRILQLLVWLLNGPFPSTESWTLTVAFQTLTLQNSHRPYTVTKLLCRYLVLQMFKKMFWWGQRTIEITLALVPIYSLLGFGITQKSIKSKYLIVAHSASRILRCSLSKCEGSMYKRCKSSCHFLKLFIYLFLAFTILFKTLTVLCD